MTMSTFAVEKRQLLVRVTLPSYGRTSITSIRFENAVSPGLVCKDGYGKRSQFLDARRVSIWGQIRAKTGFGVSQTDRHLNASGDKDNNGGGGGGGGGKSGGDFLSPPPPPDGGYGWVVVLGAFFVNVLCDGTCFSFAIFFNDLGDFYGEAEGTVAWVGSCLVGFYLLIGPFAGALADRYSCRVVCITGAIGTAIFFALSIFSPNIYVLILLYGVFGGCAMGMCYLPSVVIVGLYFEKRRATGQSKRQRNDKGKDKSRNDWLCVCNG